jgi:rubrerythrin
MGADAVVAFKGAQASEVEQSKLFKTALDELEDWKVLGKDFAVCQVCGYIVMGQPPLNCPVCSSPIERQTQGQH